MKTMKSTMARLFALCLTVVMVLSMATMGAFAATIDEVDQTGSVTIVGSANDEGATVNLYKIINVNMVDANGTIQPKDPVYTWVDAVTTWLETNANETYKGYINAADNAVTKDFSTTGASALSTFYKALSDAITAGTVSLSPVNEDDVTVSNGSASIVGLAMGQYLVTASKDVNTYNPATATLYPVWNNASNSWELNDATVVLKSKGGIEKDVVGGDLGHAVGDIVTYRLDVAIPVYPEAGPNEIVYTTFKVGDTMGTGLDFGGIEKVKVYANNSANGYEDGDLVGASDLIYTIDAQDNGFEINFNYNAVKTAVSGCTYVHVEYTGTLNENAFTTDALGNTAYVEVNTNPYDEHSNEKTTVDKKVYTYGITVTLKDADSSDMLEDGQFQVKKGDTVLKFIDNGDGTYTLAKNQDDPNAVDVVITDANGQLILQGVDTGTYTITEVVAPGGYQLPANPVATAILVDNEVNGQVDGILNGDKAEGAADFVIGSSFAGNMFTVNLKNTKPGFELPTTGGMGTVLFTAGGLVIMACGAALVLVTLKKKKAED